MTATTVTKTRIAGTYDFHDLQPGDLVRKHNTMLKVLDVHRSTACTNHAKAECTRTVVRWVELRQTPTKWVTYPGPWTSSLNLDRHEECFVYGTAHVDA